MTEDTPKLRLVTDDLIEAAAQNRAADAALIDEAVQGFDPTLVSTDEEWKYEPEENFETELTNEASAHREEAAADRLPPNQRPDVLGLVAEAVWLVAEDAKVSRGKVRRVLKAFEPLFWMRISEGYDTGYATGYYQAQVDMQNAMENAETMSEETARSLIELPPGVTLDEHADDTSGTEGREEGFSPEA